MPQLPPGRSCDVSPSFRAYSGRVEIFQLEVAFYLSMLPRHYFWAIEVPKNFLEELIRRREHERDTLLFTQVHLPLGPAGRVYVLPACPMTEPHYFRVQLGLDRLSDLAFHDIMGKLAPENIVIELFSKFTAQ